MPKRSDAKSVQFTAPVGVKRTSLILTFGGTATELSRNRNVRELVQTGHMLFHSWLRRSGVVVDVDYFVIVVVVFRLFVF